MKRFWTVFLLLILQGVGFGQTWVERTAQDDLGVYASKYATLEDAVAAANSQGKKNIWLDAVVPVATSARYTVPDSMILSPINGGGISPTRLVTIEAKVVDPGLVQWIFGTRDSVVFGNGAVAFVRPRHFGAKGDGTNDDVLAFNAAMKAIAKTGGEFRISEGHFLLKGNFKPVSNVKITGTGEKTVLDFVDDGSTQSRTMWLQQIANIAIFDIKLISSNATTRSAVYGLIRADSTDFVQIENVVFGKSPSTAIWTQFCKDWTVQKCRVDSATFADGFHFSRESRDIIVSYSTFRNTGDDAIAAVGYIDGATQRGPNRNINFLYNKIYNSQARGITLMGVVGGHIIGNEIHNSQKSGILVSATLSADSVHANRDVIIAKNKIFSSGVGASGTKSGIYLTYVRNFEISSNVVDSAGAEGITVVNAVIGGRISRNEISNCTRGILLQQLKSSNPRLIYDIATAVGDTGRTEIGIESIVIVKNTLSRSTIDGLYAVGESSLRAKNISVLENIAFDNNTSNSANVRNFFLNWVDTGFIKNNIALPGANGNALSPNVGTANSVNITVTDNL